MPRAAERMASIRFSGIRRVVERAAQLERSGQKILHFEIGRPDFDTPAHVKQAAMDALAAGDVHYSSNYGTPALRAAIARKLQRENDIIYSPDGEIIVTVGANEAVLLAFMAFLDPGDEVLVPDPAWLHYRWCAQFGEQSHRHRCPPRPPISCRRVRGLPDSSLWAAG
jgi:aminotransferase